MPPDGLRLVPPDSPRAHPRKLFWELPGSPSKGHRGRAYGAGGVGLRAPRSWDARRFVLLLLCGEPRKCRDSKKGPSLMAEKPEGRFLTKKGSEGGPLVRVKACLHGTGRGQASGYTTLTLMLKNWGFPGKQFPCLPWRTWIFSRVT